MRSGICPKCGSDEVHLGEKRKGAYRIGMIPLGGTFGRDMPRDFYICVECGYIESYISERDNLDRIAKKWPRIDKNKRKNDEY